MNKLELTTEGDRFVIVKRRFAATPEAVFRAHMEPELVRQWMTGPDGWVMTECINEARVGGSIRYAWADANGNGFHLTGEFLEIEAPNRVVHVERMFLPDPTPDNHIETTFNADGDGTLVVMRMTLPDETTRRMMLETGMADGMESSYQKLDGMLA